MTFPTLISSNAETETSNVSSHNATYSGTVIAGETLIAIVCVDGDRVVTDDATYTELFTAVNAGNSSPTLAVFYKTAAGGETTDVFTTDNPERSVVWALRISGDNGVPEVPTTAEGDSVSPDPPSLTPSAGGDILWLAIAAIEPGTGQVTAGPASYTDFLTARVNNTAGVATGWARRELNTSSENPGVFTASDLPWLAQTIAILPTAGSSTILPMMINYHGG